MCPFRPRLSSAGGSCREEIHDFLITLDQRFHGGKPPLVSNKMRQSLCEGIACSHGDNMSQSRMCDICVDTDRKDISWK